MDVRRDLQEFARDDLKGDGKNLEDIVREVQPTVLIGTSTQAGAFTEQVVGRTDADSCADLTLSGQGNGQACRVADHLPPVQPDEVARVPSTRRP